MMWLARSRVRRSVFRVAAVAALFSLATVLGSHHVRAADLLRVGRPSSIAFSFVPLDVGVETGSFERHSLDVQIIDLAGSAKVQQALAAGSIDMSTSAGPELAFVAKGAPSLGVAAMAGAPKLLVLAVRKDGGIRSVADLKGKMIGVSTTGSLTEWLVQELERQQGWPAGTIKTPALGAEPSYIAAMKTKQIDGIVIDVATEARLEQDGDARTLVKFGDIVHDFIIHVIFARNSLIEQQPDLVRRFLAAWFDTIRFMRSHKTKSVAIAARVMNVSPTIAGTVYDELMPMFSDTGRFDPKALHVLADSFVTMGMLSTKPDMSKLYTEKFLPAGAGDQKNPL